MSTAARHPTPQPERDAVPPGKPDAGRRLDPCADIVNLARRATSKTRYMLDVLRCLADHYNSPYAALHVRYASEVLQDDWHTGPGDPRFWKPGLQDFLTESLQEARPRARLLKSRTGNDRVAFLSAPLYDPSGPAIGALALVVADVTEADLTLFLANLETQARLASYSAEFIGTAVESSSGPRPPDRLMARAATCSSSTELAFAITNELRNRLACEQVALGMAHRGHVRILSISGLDHVAEKTPAVAALRGAMEECLDAGETIICQQSGDWQGAERPCAHHLHRQWHVIAGGDAVASIPLKVDNKTVVVLSVRKHGERAFQQEQLDELRDRLSTLAPALLMAERATRGVWRHAIDHTRDTAVSMVSPGRPVRKVISLLIAAAALWFCFGTMTYEVPVRAQVTPAMVRHLSAPFQAILAESFVMQGDRVKQGDVLCRFDMRELEQQRLQLAAELEVLEREKDRAMAGNAPVEVQLALANQQLARARLAIVEQRLEQAVVRAPFDGVIVSGDFRKVVGSVLNQGDPLFAVAPLNEWLLELEVPEYAAADVGGALKGAFAAFARPETVRSFDLLRLRTSAETRAERNVFIAEASLPASDAWLRPGMEGLARIHVGQRPVWWVALHGAVDWLRMKLWL